MEPGAGVMQCLENWVPKVSPCSWHGKASPAREGMGTHWGASARHLVPEPWGAWWV